MICSGGKIKGKVKKYVELNQTYQVQFMIG